MWWRRNSWLSHDKRISFQCQWNDSRLEDRWLKYRPSYIGLRLDRRRINHRWRSAVRGVCTSDNRGACSTESFTGLGIGVVGWALSMKEVWLGWSMIDETNDGFSTEWALCFIQWRKNKYACQYGDGCTDG